MPVSKDDYDFTGRAAIVTGAGGALGSSVTLRLAGCGADVLAVDLDPGALAQVCASAEELAGSVHPQVADVTDEDQVAGYVRAAVERFGKVDLFFNNAGISESSTLIVETSAAVWQRTLSINLTGAFLGLREVLRQMVQSGSGSIVNTASIGGLRAVSGAAPYCASKHGVLGLSATAALEAGPQGVRVNAVCPGPLDTPLFRADAATNPARAARIEYVTGRIPMGRVGLPSDVCELVVWLMTDEAAFVNGAAYVIDGGMIAQV